MQKQFDENTFVRVADRAHKEYNIDYFNT